MRIAPILLAVTVLLSSGWTLVFPASAHAMRCGQSLVLEGQTRNTVRRLCGEPTDVSRSTVFLTNRVWQRGTAGGIGSELTETVEVERWLYDLSGNRFPREITFHDGKVVHIKVLRKAPAALTARIEKVPTPERTR